MKCFYFSFKKCFSPSSPSSKAASNNFEDGLQTLPTFSIYSYKELKVATQGFRSTNKIGEGGFGSVYKGRLRDGTIVAVKVLSVDSRQGEREFMAEITSMSNVRHENLVKLKGGCVDGTNRILVYDYMENNSLAQTILGREHNRINFNWKARREICLGIARGLAYLHEEVKPHIVHRDIKASNILLDWNFTAKISDFGLSKLFLDNITHISTRVAGTLGYLAPEYAITGHLTRKSDIYSFGVLLLEILSGRCVVDFNIEVGEHYLVEKAWKMYKTNDLLQLIDPKLKGEFPESVAIRFLKVGLLCVQQTPSFRPQMSKVIKMMVCDDGMGDMMEIMQPGLITDLMDVKIACRQSSQSPISKISSSLQAHSSPHTYFYEKNVVHVS